MSRSRAKGLITWNTGEVLLIVYTTWTFLKFKFLDTKNLCQDALENIFGAIRLHCGSKSNPSNALKTVMKVQGTLIFHPSSASSTSPFISCKGETMDSVPDIVRTGREAQ